MPVQLKELPFRNFSGGLNTRDAASELSPNEFPDSLNCTIDERGSAMKRLGYEDRYGVAIGSGLVSNLFYWATQDSIVAQIGASVHKDGAASFKTFSSSARIGMAEFGGNLYMNHPVDGLFWYNGSVVTAVPSAPKGNTLATWQNRLWAGETGLPRLWYSVVGDPTAAWPGTNWEDFKEKDSAAITCLAGASGVDISGRPGLLVFKQDSSYRVHDSATGSYSTIDVSVGCGSNIGAVNAYGRTYVASTRGVYSTDGLGALQENSQLVENFFQRDELNQTRPDLFCAGRYQDRLFFSFPRAGVTSNGLVIEHHPIQNWVVPHTNAASCYASIGRNATDLVLGSPTNAGRVYNSHRGGSDAGVDIASKLQVNWKEPAGGNLSRIRRARFVGSGQFDATMLEDYATAQSGSTMSVNMDSDVATYDAGFLYDALTTLYGPTNFQGRDVFWSLGTANAISFLIQETSSLTQSGVSIISGTNLPVRGAWTLSYISALCIDLGNV